MTTDRMVGESYKDYAARMAGQARAAEIDRDRGDEVEKVLAGTLAGALVEIERLREELGKPLMTAGEFAELLPEHLRQTYWRTKIDEWFRGQQGMDPDQED